MTPDDIAKSLDDQDTFEPSDYCDQCGEPTARGQLRRANEYLAGWDSDMICPACYEKNLQGPSDDKWLERFYSEGVEKLDDKDEFHTLDRCQRCNSTQNVEQVYFNNTVENLCRWCAKELFIDISYHLGESLDDKDEFRNYDDSPVVAELSWPLSMDYDTALDLIQTKLAGEDINFGIDNIKDIRMTPARHRRVIIINLSEEMLEDVKNQFNEQKSDGELGSAYYYGPVDPKEPYYIQQQNKIELEIPWGDNEWIMPAPEPPEPDDDDPGFYHSDIDESIAEDIDDKDEFGFVRATAGYEESGMDDSKHIFIFEDGARMYQDAKIVDKGYGETDVQYRVILKMPDGSTHRSDTLKYSEQDLPPPFNVYMDGVYAFIRDGDILPFTSALSQEFRSVMLKHMVENYGRDNNPGIDPKELINILNSRHIKPDPEYITPEPTPDPTLPQAEPGKLDDADEFEDFDSPCEENMPHGGWDVALRDHLGNDVTEQYREEFNIGFFTGEHPMGFDTGGCLVWIEIFNDWSGERPFPTIYYWRGRWRDEDVQ